MVMGAITILILLVFAFVSNYHYYYSCYYCCLSLIIGIAIIDNITIIYVIR